MRLFHTLLLALGLVLGGGPCGAQVVHYLAAPLAITPLPAAPAYVARVVDARARPWATPRSAAAWRSQ